MRACPPCRALRGGPQSRGRPHLPRELVAALSALELPHALVPADVDAQLFNS